MSDFNSYENIVPERSKPLKRVSKKPVANEKQEEIVKKQYQEVEKNVKHIFDKTRDLGDVKQYHLDGDPQMYTAQNIKKRKQLFLDAEVQKELENFSNLFVFQDNHLPFQNYKRVHEKIAISLRPQLQQDQLEFIVKKDYQFDLKDGRLTKERLKEQLFQMVDVWTMGVDKIEYLCFLRLIKVKVSRLLLVK